MTLSILKARHKAQVSEYPFGTVEQLRKFARGHGIEHQVGEDALYVIQDADFTILDHGKILDLK
jgi:hypothetical protein